MAATAKTAEPVETDDVETVDDGLPAAVTHQIRRHAMYAAAGGLIPVPLLEIVTSGTIQIRLVAKLCDIYGVSFSENAVKAALGVPDRIHSSRRCDRRLGVHPGAHGPRRGTAAEPGDHACPGWCSHLGRRTRLRLALRQWRHAGEF